MKFIEFLKQKWSAIILILIIIFFTVQNFWFIRYDNLPQYADAPLHLNMARFYYHDLFDRSAPPGKQDLISKYPFVVHLNASVFFLIFGNSTKTALVSLFPFSIIFILSMYGIGKYLGDDVGAVACASIAASSQMFMTLSHLFLLEMPQTAATALAVFLLFKTERFTKNRFSCLSGLCLCFALMVKWSSAFYMAGPLIVYLGYFIAKKRKALIIPAVIVLILILISIGILNLAIYAQKQESRINFNPFAFMILYLGAVLIMLSLSFAYESLKNISGISLNVSRFLLIASLSGGWYFYNLSGVLGKLKLQQEEMIRPVPYPVENLMSHSLGIYIKDMRMFFTIFLIFALIGLIYVFIRREKTVEKLAVFLLGPVGIVIIAPLAPPTVFYILSMLITVAALGSCWFKYMGRLKYALLGIVLIYAFMSLTFPFYGHIPDYAGFFRNYDFFSWGFGKTVVPDRNEYPFKDALLEIREAVGNERSAATKPDQALALVICTEKFRQNAGIYYFTQDTISSVADDLNVTGVKFIGIYEFKDGVSGMRENIFSRMKFIMAGHLMEEEIGDTEELPVEMRQFRILSMKDFIIADDLVLTLARVERGD